MRLVGVGLLVYKGDANQPTFIGMATDVSNFGYFQRGTVREGIMFIARTIVQRTQPGMRQTVKNEEYLCHVHVKEGGIAGVVVADADYPTTAAFSVIGKVLDDFMQQQGADESWRNLEADGTLANPLLEAALIKYQDHTQADKIAKIQKDLDETKIILHQTIDSVLKRGEKLDALVDKSNDLSLASQMFYKQARKTNSCCRFM
ncbi:YKT6 protein [Gonium pectorale]|uniref:YKT6 protein n=1 Tax=Gonium pectorale TaxID=33097 RepID=A0A150GV09_GONPE|nr:YKT6 protein [Gonium pectorale]|eukprot:KXZ53593.1 YKT6 protein [Gonium pectorale]